VRCSIEHLVLDTKRIPAHTPIKTRSFKKDVMCVWMQESHATRMDLRHQYLDADLVLIIQRLPSVSVCVRACVYVFLLVCVIKCVFICVFTC